MNRKIIFITIGILMLSSALALSIRESNFLKDWATKRGITEQELKDDIVSQELEKKIYISNMNSLSELSERCIEENIAKECIEALEGILK